MSHSRVTKPELLELLETVMTDLDQIRSDCINMIDKCNEMFENLCEGEE